MTIPNIKVIILLATLPVFYNLKAQNTAITDTSKFKQVNNLVPRLGIGVSRHLITEFGLALQKSRFINHKDFGFNTVVSIFYISFETMTPWRKPLLYGYKLGAEFINIGHVTGAGGLEVAYYTKDTSAGLAIIPKMGLPLVNGSLSYGFAMYLNPELRKQAGRHRIILTYCFNRKSDRALHQMLARYRQGRSRR